MPARSHGGVAQLGERVNGIHEVRGSIPLASIAEPPHSAVELVGIGWWDLRDPPRLRVCRTTGLLRE